MVHAQDLRIGNWILYDGHECRVWGIQYVVPDVAYQVIIDAHKGVGGYDFDGIPLSEEWLKRFGFIQVSESSQAILYLGNVGMEKAHDEYNLILRYQTLSETGQRITKFYIHTWPVRYVHQLQNLYFALAASELTERK